MTTEIDFDMQLAFFGCAVTGDLPRDPVTLWCEDRHGWVQNTYVLWDRDAAYLDSIELNHGPPPWWFALVPAVVGGMDPYGRGDA